MPSKQCKICHKHFPATPEYFYKRAGAYDGLRNDCKECKIATSLKTIAAKKKRDQK